MRAGHLDQARKVANGVLAEVDAQGLRPGVDKSRAATRAHMLLARCESLTFAPDHPQVTSMEEANRLQRGIGKSIEKAQHHLAAAQGWHPTREMQCDDLVRLMPWIVASERYAKERDRATDVALKEHCALLLKGMVRQVEGSLSELAKQHRCSKEVTSVRQRLERLR